MVSPASRNGKPTTRRGEYINRLDNLLGSATPTPKRGLNGQTNDVLNPITVRPALEDQALLHDVQAWTLIAPCMVRLAGGGLNTLLLGRVYYWSSPRLGGFGRSRSIRRLASTAIATTKVGHKQLAGEMGLDTTTWDTASASRRKYYRILSSLTKRQILRTGTRKRDAGGIMLGRVAIDDLVQHGLAHLRLSEDGKTIERLSMTPGRISNKLPMIKVWRHEVQDHGLNAALVLSHLLYYHEQRSDDLACWYLFDRHRWLARSNADLVKQTGLSPKQVRYALDYLHDNHWIVSVIKKVAGTPRHLLRIDQSVMDQILARRAEAKKQRDQVSAVAKRSKKR